jgi:hypothetical protein
MDKLIEEFKEAGGVPAEKSGGGDDNTQKLIKAVAKIVEWDLGNVVGLKAAVQELYGIVSTSTDEKLDLPESPKEAKTKIFEVVNTNRDKTAQEMIPLLIERFGFAQDKKKKAEKKQAAIAGMVGCAANAGILAALQELSELYFKEGNRNAGGTYTKAVNAIKDIQFEITEDNAKGLGKGKTKVANIGKGTAEKMHEFVTTGTIAKLEEKRGDAA